MLANRCCPIYASLYILDTSYWNKAIKNWAVHVGQFPLVHLCWSMHADQSILVHAFWPKHSGPSKLVHYSVYSCEYYYYQLRVMHSGYNIPGNACWTIHAGLCILAHSCWFMAIHAGNVATAKCLISQQTINIRIKRSEHEQLKSKQVSTYWPSEVALWHNTRLLTPR